MRARRTLAGLATGFACLGARLEPPTAQFSLHSNPIAPGDSITLDGTRSFAANGDGLRVTDANGRTDPAFHELRFTGDRAPSTTFDVQPDPAIAGPPARFEAVEGPETFSWDFEGDGEFTVPSPQRCITHTYLTPRERIVRLRVTDAAGQVSELTRVLSVRPPETAGGDVSAVARAAARQASGPGGRRFRARLRGATLATPPR